MVHQTMNTSNTSAPSASSNNKVMAAIADHKQGVEGKFCWRARSWRLAVVAGIVGSLVACATPVAEIPPAPADIPPLAAPADPAALPPAIQRAGSRWVPVHWAELPGWGPEGLHAVWNAWVRGCERPAPGQATLCAEVRQLSIATNVEQQAWVVRRLQPYRVTEPDGTPPSGLLTGYYEPIMDARRQPSATHRTPLYAPPASL
ncbi:MAG: membrane-bound lytic murein transglycosylase A, partial [Hydrogenophaga sp.]